MKDLETRINKQLQDRTSHKEMDEASVSYAEITKTTIKQDLTSEMSEVQKTLKEAREQAEEEVEKEKRKNNIIVYRMPESTADSMETRRKEDHDFVINLLVNALETECEPNDVSKIALK